MIIIILILSHLTVFLLGGLMVGKYMLCRLNELHKLIEERLLLDRQENQ